MPDVRLTGRAQTGADHRDVGFRFSCTTNKGPSITGALSIELHVPNFEQLDRIFDFDPFQGPAATSGPRTRVQAGSARGEAQAHSDVAGWVSGDDPRAFVLGLAAPLRGGKAKLASVARVLSLLTVGPSTLVWRQDNVKPGGAAIEATLKVTAADVDRSRKVLAPCFAAAAR